MGVTYNSHIVKDGLILCLDPGSVGSYPRSGSTWKDLTKNANGTLINDATFSSANEGVITFDGTDDYIDCGGNAFFGFSSGESFTLSVWFKGTSARGAIVVKGYDAGGQERPWYMLWCNNNSDGHVNLYVRSTSGSFVTTNSTKINDDEWHSIIGVYDASAATITTYTDGVAGTPVGSVSAQPYGTNSRPFVIGKHFGEELNGSIGPVHVYNKALSAAEVVQNYNVIKRRYL